LSICVYSSSDATHFNNIRWPSIDEDTFSGFTMRLFNRIAIAIAFVWIFIVSVPLAIRKEDKRKEVMSSSLYSNSASVLSGCLFLPIVIGLVLPMNCGNGPLASYNNISRTFNGTNAVYFTGANATIDDSPYTYFSTCWTGMFKIEKIKK
jgi:hypothetical protein